MWANNKTATRGNLSLTAEEEGETVMGFGRVGSWIAGLKSRLESSEVVQRWCGPAADGAKYFYLQPAFMAAFI